MAQHSGAKITGIVVGVSICMLLVVGPLARLTIGQVESSPAAKLAELGIKFEGSRSCNAADCHGKKGDDAPPTEIGHEQTIWAAHDRHHEAYETLGSDESKEMGQKLSIADVKTSDSCLSCHALNVRKELQGENFSIREGNTCDNCHGPSEKWIKPHAEKGWTQTQRKSMSHDALLKQWGLYDTKPLAQRATMCTGCHLAIDADLVVAGHPQPTFELDWFQEIEPKHWLTPDEKYYSTKVWLAGQVACLRDSMNQLAMRAKGKKDPAMVKSAYQQAMSHLMVLKPTASAAGLNGGSLDASATELSKAITDPAANSDTIAAKASALAEMANVALPKVNGVTADRQLTLAALSAIASSDGMAKDLGRFGMDQQSLALAALYNSYAKAEGVADAERDVINKLIEEKLMPPEEGEPNIDDYAKALSDLKGKLPR
jgi:hypothetical protein